MILKLVLSNFTARRSRVALTVAAVALSVSLVVSVTGGYASLFEAVFSYLNQYMGATDARITCPNSTYGIPGSILAEVRKDPAVRQADGRIEAGSSVADPEPDRPTHRKGISLVGIDRPSDLRVDRLKLASGTFFNTSAEKSAVIDQTLAELLKLKVGDTLELPKLDKKLAVKIVGIDHKPAVLAMHRPTVYLPIRTCAEFVGAEGNFSTILIDLKDGADHDAFAARWSQKLATYTPSMKIHMRSGIRSQMDTNLQGVVILNYMGSAVSMLAATFIIFSALSMGVAERQRSLAMLRAVGAYKSQIGQLVVVEGILLAGMGIAIGVPLGYLWLKILTLIFPAIFSAGVILSVNGVLFAVGGTLITALAASLLPAWSATRVSPLAAMSPLSNAGGSGAPVGWAIAGLMLISFDMFLLQGPVESLLRGLGSADPRQTARALEFYLHFFIGLPSLFVGFFLLAPMCVWVVERMAGPLVAAMLGLRPALLRQQLSTGLWRAAGTAAAMMVGLSVLVSMQIGGHTLLGGWKLPDRFPDLFVGTSGLSPEQEKILATTQGFTRLMPITIASTAFGGNPFAIATSMSGGSSLVPESTMFIGLDPGKVFDHDGKLGMMELDFREGTQQQAYERLKEGGWVLVTQEYRELTHAKIGDVIKLGGRTVAGITLREPTPFRIAGVVWSPGIDVMVGMYDMGDQFEERTISTVFGSVADSEKYFGAKAYVWAAEIDAAEQRDPLIKRIRAGLGEEGLQVADVREIKKKIEDGFFRLLNMMSSVAYAAMAVASLGVTNTIMAGIRTRRWQFGILRSIGVTRGQLLRLVLAEALVLGLISCVLGLGAGFEMGFDANALTGVTAGYRPSLVIPWIVVMIGVGAVLVVSLCASLWPAIQVARSTPLTLLQAGRSAT